MMAVDQIARMMAMDAAQQGGGGGDSYTKAETDALLDGKADLVDGKVPAAQLPPYTVDQTYDATSTNPQSGAAVAQAVSGKISATDYATQTTGGTIKAWTTTDGSDTILHLATQ